MQVSGTPHGHQLLCGTAISVQPERGFMLYSVFLSHSTTAVECVSQRSNSIIRRQKIWLLALGNSDIPGKLHLRVSHEDVSSTTKRRVSGITSPWGSVPPPGDTRKGHSPTQQSTRERYLASSMQVALQHQGIACMLNSKYALEQLAEAGSRLVGYTTRPMDLEE